MELGWLWMSAALTLLVACYVFVFKFLRSMNGWYYDLKLRNKKFPLPPGDMGWPLIGNFLAFLRDFSSGVPDSFLNNIVSKYVSFIYIFSLHYYNIHMHSYIYSVLFS